MKHQYITIVLVFFTFQIFAQKVSDSRLAAEYYRSKDFAKAAVLYKKLSENSSSQTYFTYYVNCLIELKELANAEKVVKRRVKKYPNELAYYVDLGHVYEVQGNESKSKQSYEKAIKKLTANKNQIIRLANSFRMKRKWDFAEIVYLEGRKLLKDNTIFSNEMANNFMAQRKYNLMIDEYLNMLTYGSSSLKSVQQRLQSVLFMDVNDDLKNLIKQNLVRRIQANPNQTQYSELLVWFYIQGKEFDKAFFQAKAIDKRNNENGNRIISLGKVARSNKNFDLATESFNYVINKGSNCTNHYIANEELLHTLFLKYEIGAKNDRNAVLELENKYKNTINKFGKSARTIKLVKEFGHILAFYLHKKDEAIKILEEAITYKNIKPEQLAYCKLELADIYLLQGNIWEATLVYAKVEKTNKNNPIGHEAKFRKARLAYYAGDFQWAEAQLDVLKASTSKLIANDAFELSQLINDNTALDTSETALKMFALADLFLYQGNNISAESVFDSILIIFPNHSLIDEVYLRKAKLMLKNEDTEMAVEYYQKLIDNYAHDIYGDDALFALAKIYDYRYANTEKAIELYQKLLTEFPGSIFVVEARKRFRTLRGDNPEIEEVIN
ncbi:MAG: tetratricopeptide repeat protein [Bacteroidetes bacterium]|nr:tetratricopeptide repeat protein [Bacteroidota bacterium]